MKPACGDGAAAAHAHSRCPVPRMMRRAQVSGNLVAVVAMARSRGRARNTSPAWGEMGTWGRVEGIKNGRSEM
jgi:hypothetical protein